MVKVIDDFLMSPRSIKQEIISFGFKDIIYDGITYPRICLLPLYSFNLDQKLGLVMGFPVKINHMFARIMPIGHKSPHTVHSDEMMGKYSAHVYLSGDPLLRALCPEYGLSLMEYVGHIRINDQTLHIEDYKDDRLWNEYEFIPAEFNRLVVHDSSLFHCAMPTEGFGSTPEDARFVLTCFFDPQ